MSQPLIVDTAPILDVQPNTENLERDETVHVVRFLSESCGCDLANGPAAVHSHLST